MIGQSNKLAELAERDSTVGPLARLQLEALRAAEDPAWERGLPSFGTRALTAGAPVLHELTLEVEPALMTSLWGRLVDLIAREDQEAARPLRLRRASGIDPLAAVGASIAGNAKRLEEIAGQLGSEPGLVATLAQLAAVPLLHACGRRATAVVSAVSWDVGFCPVCAAWPTLAEMRGLERERWLRCGRCGSGWAFRRMTCVYCGNTDLSTQGYLAPEAQREARRAETCDRCSGYLKSFAVLRPLAPDELFANDLATVEMDITALDQGYARPERPAFSLKFELRPSARARGWLPWSA